MQMHIMHVAFQMHIMHVGASPPQLATQALGCGSEGLKVGLALENEGA